MTLLFAGFVGLRPVAAEEKTALPFVSPIFGDNMVLQRGRPNTIWGWSQPGDTLRVELAGRVAQTVAQPDGRWQAQIEPPAPGGPYTLTVDGSQHVVLHEVLVGDVWLCGGQSNTQFGLSGARQAQTDNDGMHAGIVACAGP